MNFKNVKAERTTETRNTHKIETLGTGNLYETIVVLSKRSNQLSQNLKKELAEKMEELDVGGKSSKKKRRGAAAKKVNKFDTRVIVQKISRNRKKAVTHVVGMDTVPGLKLKDASKAFSKRFAGSSSVKDKEIIIQGDHLEDVAEMIVNKFGVSADMVFLDLDGESVSFG